MKIKKRTEERTEGFPIKDQKEVKGEKKQFSIKTHKNCMVKNKTKNKSKSNIMKLFDLDEMS